MISGQDIAGLALGAAEAFLAPLLILLAIRRKCRIDMGYVGVGAAVGVLGILLFPYAFPAVSAALDALVWKVAGRDVHLPNSFWTFETAFAPPATAALFNLTLGLVALALLRRRDPSGRPALAVGLGLYGLICWAKGRGLLAALALAVSASNSDLERVFGAGERFASTTFANWFQLGLPKGAAAGGQFAVSLILFVVADGGWRYRRGLWIVVAYGAAVGLAAAYAAISAFSQAQAAATFVARHYSHSLEAALMKARPDFNSPWFTVGATETFATALGLALVLAYSWFGDRLGAFVEAAPAPRSPSAEVSSGLFETWKNQSQRE